MDDDAVWKWTLGICGVVMVGVIVYAATREDEPERASTSGGWSAPVAPAPVVVQQHNDGFWSGYWWGRAMHSTPAVVHHETEVHHVYHQAPSYTPAPVRVSTPAAKPAAAVKYTPAPAAKVSAIKTVSSPAVRISTSGFRAGGRR